VASGTVEDDLQGPYGSPQVLHGGTSPTTASFRWQNPNVPAGTTVHWRIRFCDVSGNCAVTADQSFAVAGPASLSLTLQPGWNLVSLPSVPAQHDVPSVLAALAGRYGLVYAWDAAAGVWRKYDAQAPAYANDLATLEPSQGFWLQITAAQPQVLTLAGEPAASTDISLHPGWNLVGYPSAVSRALPAALRDHGLGTDYSLVYAYHAVEGATAWKLFDPAAPSSLNALTPGWGYWVLVTGSTDQSWTVNYAAP
jgi:hypothetical protein